MPNANEAAASPKGDQGLPTHHMVAESRPLQLGIAPAMPHQYTSMAVATQPCLSIVS